MRFDTSIDSLERTQIPGICVMKPCLGDGNFQLQSVKRSIYALGPPRNSQSKRGLLKSQPQCLAFETLFLHT
jgi:hypothetical protein